MSRIANVCALSYIGWNIYKNVETFPQVISQVLDRKGTSFSAFKESCLGSFSVFVYDVIAKTAVKVALIYPSLVINNQLPVAEDFISDRLFTWISYVISSLEGPVYACFDRVILLANFRFESVECAVFRVCSETIVFQGIIQSFLLHDLPRYIVRKIDPQYESYFDGKVMRLARIILSAGVFALAHENHKSVSSLAPQFIGGLFYACIREKGDCLVKIAIIHRLYNSSLDLLDMCLFAINC
jgi:hypothetical protein